MLLPHWILIQMKIDYLLNSYSKFNVIGNSGVAGISSILRKLFI